MNCLHCLDLLFLCVILINHKCIICPKMRWCIAPEECSQTAIIGNRDSVTPMNFFADQWAKALLRISNSIALYLPQ